MCLKDARTGMMNDTETDSAGGFVPSSESNASGIGVRLNSILRYARGNAMEHHAVGASTLEGGILFFCYIERRLIGASMVRRCIALSVWCVLGIVFAAAQPRDGDIKFRLAQSYERSGDFENAAKLYEEILARDSTNVVVVESLERSYVQLKRYDDAIALIEHILRQQPSNINYLAQLGGIYVLLGDEARAAATWERAIAINPQQEATYRVVANAILQNRLFDRAIELFLRGRTVLNNRTLFSNDIAYLYAITMRFADATREYLSVLQQSPGQLGYIQSRIAGYTGRSEGLAAATQTVERAHKSDPSNSAIQELLAWLYMEGRQFDRAYDVYASIDKSRKANGRELYGFGERALREKAYTAAARAYQEIMTSYPDFPYVGGAKFGYACTIEGITTERDTFSIGATTIPNIRAATDQGYANAIAAFERVVREHPQTDVGARSLLRIADIQYSRLDDRNGARAALEAVVKSYPQFPEFVDDARLQLGEVLLSLGDVEATEQQYSHLASRKPIVGAAGEKALFRLAELQYFRGNFQDALDLLQDLLRNPISDATNDALSLQILIKENQKPTEAALKAFARAQLLQRERKFSESLSACDDILAKYPNSSLVDETFELRGDLLAQMGKFREAVASYERLIADFPKSIALDKALISIGRIYQTALGEREKAIETYQRLLEKYPASIYTTEARKRIRVLRGDTI
jgi:tetratricopeptide (TPR) repeat protein